jgi:MFS family permease
VPEIVSDEEIPSAATLGGLQLNISWILGPAMGGMLLPLFGANWVFTLNAVCFTVCFLIVVLAFLQWKRKERPSKLPLECFFESFFTAIRYVRYAMADADLVEGLSERRHRDVRPAQIDDLRKQRKYRKI